MKKSIFIFVIALGSFGLSTQVHAQQKKPTLNHIAIYVVDLKVSSDFYSNIIQLDTIPEPFHDNKHTWYRVGPLSHLHVISGAKEKIAHDKNGHLCFTVESVADFIPRLDKAKIPYEDWPGSKGKVTTRVDGVKQIYFQDPDGYWIEINDAKD